MHGTAVKIIKINIYITKVCDLLKNVIYCTNEICKDMQCGQHKTVSHLQLHTLHSNTDSTFLHFLSTNGINEYRICCVFIHPLTQITALFSL